MVAIPVILALVWWQFEWLLATTPDYHNLPLYLDRISTGQILLCFGMSMVGASPILYGLWRIRKVFHSFERGTFFTATTARGMRMFALMIMLSVIVRPLTTAMTTVLLTLNNPPGEGTLALSFGSGNIETLFVGLVFFAIAHVMTEGQKLAEDNAQII